MISEISSCLAVQAAADEAGLDFLQYTSQGGFRLTGALTHNCCRRRVEAYAAIKDCEGAVRILASMRNDAVPPDNVSFSTAMQA